MDVYTSERLYLELAPVDKSLVGLTTLQQELPLRKPAWLIRPQKLHLTVIHFGIVREVYQELLAYNSRLTYEAYLSAVSFFVHDIRDLLPRQTTLRATGFHMFGPARTVLALTLHPNDELTYAHSQSLERLGHLLISCGINDVPAFIYKSHNFRYAPDLNPHITLARNVRTLKERSLPSYPASFDFHPAALHGL